MSGDHIKLAATVEFLHTATLLHDDVVAKTPLSPEDKALLARFGTTANPETLNAAANDLRTQRGVRERTANAIEASGHFLPMMEATLFNVERFFGWVSTADEVIRALAE